MRRANVRGASATASASSSIAKSRAMLSRTHFSALAILRVLARQIGNRHERRLGTPLIQQQIVGAGLGQAWSGEPADDRKHQVHLRHRRATGCDRPIGDDHPVRQQFDRRIALAGTAARATMSWSPAGRRASPLPRAGRCSRRTRRAWRRLRTLEPACRTRAGTPGSSASRRVRPLTQRRCQDRGR